MKIELVNISKRFIREWIIKDFDYEFVSGKCYGLQGQNGSGKSTLLSIISSAMTPSTGRISYAIDDQYIEDSYIYKYLVISSVSSDLIEDFTANEMLEHFKKFKSLDLNSDTFFQQLDLVGHEDKLIQSYSSGMKQRLSLGLALNAEAELILLDEPSSYLDSNKKAWFYKELEKLVAKQKIIIIASNDKADFQFCDEIIQL